MKRSGSLYSFSCIFYFFIKVLIISFSANAENSIALKEFIAVGIKPSQISKIESYGYKKSGLRYSRLLNNYVVIITPPRNKDSKKALSLLRKKFPLAIIDFNHEYKPNQSHSNDGTKPLKTNAEKLANISESEECFLNDFVPGARDICTETKIGVADVGFNMQEFPELRGQNIRYLNIPSNNSGQKAIVTHGADIVGLIAGNSQGGRLGALPGAQTLFVDLNFITRDGGGVSTTTDNVLRGIEKLIEAGAQVINISVAGPGNNILRHAARLAFERKVIIVAPIGNEKNVSYPGGYPQTISVDAISGNRNLYQYSPDPHTADFAAPGVALCGSSKNEGLLSGTSFASPHVAIAVAYLLCKKGDELRELTRIPRSISVQ